MAAVALTMIGGDRAVRTRRAGRRRAGAVAAREAEALLKGKTVTEDLALQAAKPR